MPSEDKLVVAKLLPEIICRNKQQQLARSHILPKYVYKVSTIQPPVPQFKALVLSPHCFYLPCLNNCPGDLNDTRHPGYTRAIHCQHCFTSAAIQRGFRTLDSFAKSLYSVKRPLGKTVHNLRLPLVSGLSALTMSLLVLFNGDKVCFNRAPYKGFIYFNS